MEDRWWSREERRGEKRGEERRSNGERNEARSWRGKAKVKERRWRIAGGVGMIGRRGEERRGLMAREGW